MSSLRLGAVLARSLRAHALVEPATSMAEAIVAAAGIYGSSPTSHLGLAARLDAYVPSHLERERLGSHSILRVPGMRGSVFLAPSELVPAFLGLSRPGTVRRTLAGTGVTEAEHDRLASVVERALADSTLSAREIRQRLGPEDPGGPVLTLILRGLAHEGRIVAAEPVGGERATAYRYARMADWAPHVSAALDVDAALAVMAPVWMQANGPGTVEDLAWWAGVTKARARGALEAMDARRVDVEGLDGDQWASDEVIEEADSAGPLSGVVRFLPVWDAWLMARRERSRLIDEAIRPFVVDRSGNVTNTITLDGRVVGTWDVAHRKLRAWLPKGVPSGLDAATERLRAFHDWTTFELQAKASPLDDGGQNAFKAPLRSRA